MSEQPQAGDTPEFDLADRMRKALRHAGIQVAEMASYLGVSRTSVSNWINGRVEPSVQTLRLWALRCGVDYGWLTGDRRRGSLRSGQGPYYPGNSLRFPQVRPGHRKLAVAA